MRILLLSADDSVIRAFKQADLPDFALSVCGSVMAATVMVEEMNPRFVFVDALIRGAKDFTAWLRRTSGSQIIAIIPEDVNENFPRAAYDACFNRPVTSVTVLEAVHALIDNGAGSNREDTNDVEFWDITKEIRGAFADVFPDEAGDEPKAKRSRVDFGDPVQVISQEVIAIWGAKGGVGRTTLAVALCSHLSDLDVLLIDLNFKEGPGDVNALLDMPPVPHIGSLLEAANDRRRGFMDSLIKAGKGSFAVIQPPPTIDQAELVSPDDVVELIDQARRSFQIIVVDLPPDLSPVTLEAVDMSTSVVLVTDTHIGSLARIARLRSFIRKDIHKCLVLNRSDVNPTKAKEIAHWLEIPLAAQIAEEKYIKKAENSGKILTVCDSIINDSVRQVAKAIFGVETPDKKRRFGLFGLVRAALSNLIG